MGLIPAGSAESYLDMDGGRVRVLRSTATPADSLRRPLLLLHGGGTDNAAISWYEVFEPWGNEREVAAIDLPGFGRTQTIEPVGGAPEMADFVARAAERLGITPCIVVGVSMGGDVALNLALRHPDLVVALVLIAPGGLTPVFRNRFLQLLTWLAAQLPDRLLMPLAQLANRHIDLAIRAVVKDPATIPQEVLAEFAREAPETGSGISVCAVQPGVAGPIRDAQRPVTGCGPDHRARLVLPR